MGMFDWLTGTKKPAAGVAARAPGEVRAALLEVNRPTAPFVVRDGAPDEVDLVAEWKIVDAAWNAVFARAGLQQVFKIFMRLDPAKSELRTVDQEWKVEWVGGAPRLSLSTEKFRGQKVEVSGGQGYAFTEQDQYGQVFNYKFRTGELKRPLRDAATGAGWVWRGVSFGKL